MIIIKKYINLHENIRRQLIGLTLRKLKSGMLYSLRNNDKDNYDVAYYIIDNKILGWALIDLKLKTIMIYIRRNCRRRGIGTKIMKIILNKYGKFEVYKWNEYSSKFFESIGY